MAEQAGRAYRFGPFRMAVSDRLLYRDQQLVALPPKAFDTLLVLVANSGRVVAKNTLMQQIWPDTFVEEGTLAQYISVLRKTLGEHGTWIENHPRRGYRFTALVEDVADGCQEPQATPSVQPHRTRLGTPGLAFLTVAALAVVTGSAVIWNDSKGPTREEAPTKSAKAGNPRSQELVFRARGLMGSNPTPGDLRTAATILEQAIAADPDLPDAYGWLAHAQELMYHNGLTGTGSFRAAMSNANRALSIDPESPIAMRALVGIQHSAGREVEGLVMALKVLRQDPDGVDARAAAAEAYFRTGLYERAIPLYRSALAAEPENRFFRRELSRMYLFLGEYAKGIEVISVLPPSQVGPFGMLLYAETGRMDKAVEVARTDSEGGLLGLFGYFRGCVLAASGDVAGAEKIWMEGVRLGEAKIKEYDNPYLHHALSIRYAKLGDREKALHHVRMALRDDPRHPVFLFFTAETEAVLGDRREALDNLQAAVDNGFFNGPLIAYQGRPMMAFHGLRDEPRFQSLLKDLERRVVELGSRY